PSRGCSRTLIESQNDDGTAERSTTGPPIGGGFYVIYFPGVNFPCIYTKLSTSCSFLARGRSRMIREADARTRTGDPFITSEVLYQLSYVGEGPSLAPVPSSCPSPCPVRPGRRVVRTVAPAPARPASPSAPASRARR